MTAPQLDAPRGVLRSLLAAVNVVIVSIYLAFVALFLLASGRIKDPGFGPIIRSLFRRRFSGGLTEMTAETGHCYLAAIPSRLPSDQDSASRLRLFEDGRELGPAHSAHDDIRTLGAGHFSHWGNQIYFSSSDNSDPRSNGRRYTATER